MIFVQPNSSVFQKPS